MLYSIIQNEYLTAKIAKIRGAPSLYQESLTCKEWVFQRIYQRSKDRDSFIYVINDYVCHRKLVPTPEVKNKY